MEFAAPQKRVFEASERACAYKSPQLRSGLGERTTGAGQTHHSRCCKLKLSRYTNAKAAPPLHRHAPPPSKGASWLELASCSRSTSFSCGKAGLGLSARTPPSRSLRAIDIVADAFTYLVLCDEPARVVRVFVDELLGVVGAGEQEDGAVARFQEGST